MYKRLYILLKEKAERESETSGIKHALECHGLFKSQLIVLQVSMYNHGF